VGREEYFKAKDKTGEIYVVTEQVVPKKGKGQNQRFGKRSIRSGRRPTNSNPKREVKN
jgi:hypothetical protein